MLLALQNLIVRISRTWWLYLLVTGLAVGSLLVLQEIAAAFRPPASGLDPLDLQNQLAPGEVYAQFASYEPGAAEIYLRFALVDFGFPLFAGLFVAATIAWSLRSALPGLYRALTDRRLLVLPLLGTAFDWMENLAVLIALGLYPVEVGGLPALVVGAKCLKLGAVAISNLAMFGLLAVAAARHAGQVFRRG